uniref:Uncharacterized protein n=1 Tax=Anguilla anguilla TaxID=7936 RepID=A0A0E9VUP5_ANGAN
MYSIDRRQVLIGLSLQLRGQLDWTTLPALHQEIKSKNDSRESLEM